MKNKIIFCVLTILLFSCSKKESKKEYLEFCFFKKGINFPISINCSSIHDEAYREMRSNKVVSNPEFISKFKKLNKNLKNTDDVFSIDTRIQIITHLDNKSDTICISKTQRVSINSKNKINSEKFVEFILEEVYK